MEVRTWVVAGLPWHIRIHRIETGRALDAAEGGFALGQETELAQQTDNSGTAVSTAWGTSGIKGLTGYGKAELIWPNANTNLLRPRTVLPTLTATLEPGIHWLASAVYGDPPADSSAQQVNGAGNILEQSPEALLQVSFAEDGITVQTTGGTEIFIPIQ